jgi:hypothetical protein
MLKINLRYFWLVILFLCPFASHAILEDIQVGLSQPYKVPLRWENIKEAPLWVNGKLPKANQDWGMYQVKLQPNELVTVWLAEGQWLRIHHPDEAFSADALKVAVSSGTGLYAYVPVYPAEEGKSLLLTPDLSTPRLVRITVAPQQDDAVAMALFISRSKAIFNESAPLSQEEIPLPTDRVALQFGTQTNPNPSLPTSEEQLPTHYWLVQKHSPVTMKVQGPTQLSLESRFIYPPTEVVLQQAYRVSVRLGNEMTQLLEFETSVDNQKLIALQGKPLVLGRSEMTYLKVPAGEHELQLSSSANLFVRLILKTREEQIEYLFPDASHPDQYGASTVNRGMPQRLDSFEETFWYLEAEVPLTLKAHGPAQLRLESRFIYPPADSVLDAIYRVSIGMDGNKTQVFDFESTSEYQQSRVINGQSFGLGLPEVAYFSLPAGEHELQLSSSANLYVRVISITRKPITLPDYLFSELNRPPLPEIKAVAENQVPEWLNRSSWQLSEDEIRTLYLSHIDTPEAIRHISLRLIRDNSRREGGLLGAMAMREAARRRPYEARVRNLAKGLLGRHSFYRNLVPWQKRHNDSQAFHRFIAYQLRDPTAQNRQLVVAKQHQDAYLKRVSGAYFAPIQVSTTKPQVYKLPRRTVPSLLRVIVKQQTQPQRQTFFLQFDEEAPIRLQLEPYVFEVPSHYYRFAQGEAGLKMLALAHGTDADTLGGPFASRYTLGSLIDASTFVLPLPPQVRQIKVWQIPLARPSSSNGSTSSASARPSMDSALSSIERPLTGTEPLYVALQYRAARRHYRLGETEYLEAVSHFASDEALFRDFVTALTSYTGNSTKKRPKEGAMSDAQQDLYNYWLPFIRFLHAQRKHFLATVYRPAKKNGLSRKGQGEGDFSVKEGRGKGSFSVKGRGEGGRGKAELNRLVAQARQAQADKQWLVALEKWTDIAQRSQGALHRQAQLAREEALEQLGEFFLAKRLLQGLFLDSTDPRLSQNAFEKLLHDYQQRNEKAAQLPLLATTVLHNPTPAWFKRLTQALIENGYYDYAFMVGMALPSAQRPNALMIEQAYRLGWWHSFAQLLRYLPDDKIWLGYRAQDNGNYAGATQLWRTAGAEGIKLANALKKGLQVREQLQTPEDAVNNILELREQAIKQWEQWQAEHPGPRHWKTADELVHDYINGELTYSIERDLYFYSFIGTPQRPVKLRIPGPLRIRLSVRTLHHKDEVEPLDSWVKLKETPLVDETDNSPKLHVLRLNNILPSRGLRIVGQPDKRLGHQTIGEYEFGPGLHEVEIFADDRPIAVKVKAERPRLPLAVLPPLNKDTLAVALMLQDANLAGSAACRFIASSYPVRGERATPAVEPLSQVTESLAASESLRFSRGPKTGSFAANERVRFTRRHKMESFAANARIRSTRRPTKDTAANESVRSTRCSRAVLLPDCQCLDCAMLIPHCVIFTSYNQYIKRYAAPINEHLRRWQARALQHGPSPEESHTELGPNMAPFQKGVLEERHLSKQKWFRGAQIAKYLAAENYAAILALPVNEDDDSEIIKRMALLLWIAEQAPEHAQQAVAAGAALFHKHPKVAKLRPLWAALRANSHWKSLSSVESSAGLRFIKLQGWQPESPSQRIRKTLLKSVKQNEQIITGHRQLGLSLFNLAETSLELVLRMDDVAYFRPVPMNVVYWLDEQPHQRLQLTPAQPTQKVRLVVPKGEHVLYVAIDKPVANQFLRLQVKDIGRNNTPLIMEYERSYHVATQEEPVVVTVRGPNWVRVDEWDQDSIYSRFQSVSEGWHTLTFRPRQGQDAALFRVHELAPVTEQQPEVQFRYFSVDGEVLPDPVVHIYKLPAISSLDVKDAFPLGTPKDGIWSFTGLVQRRKNVEEDETGFQDFIELRATHRYFDEMKNRHHRTEWLTRFNDHFDITFGARKRLRFRFEERDLTVQLAGSAYVQQVWGAGTEWHGRLKGTVLRRMTLGEKTFHVPSVSAFGRLLSLDDSPDDYAARLDNDVYSDYKADHRFGVTIADRLTHRPWLDTLWVGRVALTSNEKVFKPDYLSFNAAWKQLLGNGQVDVGYRFSHYWADDDRNRSYNRHFLSLNAGWDFWRQNQTRWELGVKLQQDLDSRDLLGMLYITWHGGKGHPYRDFMPGEIDFLSLRKRRVPQDENNEIMRVW